MIQHKFVAKALEWEWNIVFFGTFHLTGEFVLNGGHPPIPGDVLIANKPFEPSTNLHFADGVFVGGTLPQLTIRIPGEANQTFHPTMWSQWDGALIFFRSESQLDPKSTQEIAIRFTEDGEDPPFIRLHRSLPTPPSGDLKQI
jgi:hypothetical protein